MHSIQRPVYVFIRPPRVDPPCEHGWIMTRDGSVRVRSSTNQHQPTQQPTRSNNQPANLTIYQPTLGSTFHRKLNQKEKATGKESSVRKVACGSITKRVYSWLGRLIQTMLLVCSFISSLFFFRSGDKTRPRNQPNYQSTNRSHYIRS